MEITRTGVTPGVGATVAVAVGVGATVAVAVGVGATVAVAVGVGATVAVAVGVGATVAVAVGVGATVAVAVGVGATVAVAVGVGPTPPAITTDPGTGVKTGSAGRASLNLKFEKVSGDVVPAPPTAVKLNFNNVPAPVIAVPLVNATTITEPAVFELQVTVNPLESVFELSQAPDVGSVITAGLYVSVNSYDSMFWPVVSPMVIGNEKACPGFTLCPVGAVTVTGPASADAAEETLSCPLVGAEFRIAL
jgi:hypothetical protein